MNLESQALAHFGCQAVKGRKRNKKAEKVSATVQRFKKVMSGPNPPRTQEEAVAAVAPLLVYLIGILFRQLMIEVIKWCWEKYNEGVTD